jgi:ectoine hydroxylase-related dioxygenase (phytanoyl-CoA dioxygenase family)
VLSDGSEFTTRSLSASRRAALSSAEGPGRATPSIVPLRHLEADATTGEEVAKILRRDGAVVVQNLIDAATASAIRTDFEPYLQIKQPGADQFAGPATKRLGSLIERVPQVHPLVTHPVVLDTVGDVFSDATTFQLNATQVVAISPGEQRQSLHRDQWAWDHFPWPVGYEVEVSTMWAFTEFTADNGATRVALGSHCAEGRPRFDESELSVAEMAAGSALFYTGSVLHGGGANTTTSTRVGAIISYTRGWLRQHENQYLSVPVEQARNLPEQLQRLIGYSRGAYAVGYWGDMDDPIEAVRPGAGTTGLGGSLTVPTRAD